VLSRRRTLTNRDTEDGPNGRLVAANVVQALELQLPGGSTLLFGGNPAFMRDQARIAWREEPTDDALWDPARNSGLAMASESFSHRFFVGPKAL
jgi:hypothetical protein